MHDNIPLLTQSQKQNFANTVYSKAFSTGAEDSDIYVGDERHSDV